MKVWTSKYSFLCGAKEELVEIIYLSNVLGQNYLVSFPLDVWSVLN